MHSKITTALGRIQKTLETIPPNHCFVSFSGGKDSIVVLRLVTALYRDVLVVHNANPEIDPAEIVKMLHGHRYVITPSKERHATLIQALDLRCSFDGTRRDEHDRTDGKSTTVVFDGKNVNRSFMEHWMTHKGLADIPTCFPVFDWTDDDINGYNNSFARIRHYRD